MKFLHNSSKVSTQLLLVAVTDGYNFEFSIRAAERKRQTEESSHMLEIEIIDKQRHFKIILGIRTIKPTWRKHLFWKRRGTLQKVLTPLQTNYFANHDGAADCVTSQRSERIDFYCNHEEANSKMFANIKFLCDNIRLNQIC